MALPSQTERTHEMSRPVMTRTGGRSKGPDAVKIAMIAGGVLLTGVAAYGVYWLVSGDDTPVKEVAAEPAGAEVKKTSARDRRAVGSLGVRGATPGVVGSSPASMPAPGLLSQALAAPAEAPTLDPLKPKAVDVTRPDLTPTPAPTTRPAAALPLQPAAEVAPLAPVGATQEVRSLIDAGDRASAANKLVEARGVYSRALLSPDAASGDRDALRQKLAPINQDLVFSPVVAPGDTLSEAYTVQAGDSLVRITKRRELATDWRLTQRVNRLTSPNALKVGQKLKLVRGPFHAVVDKGDHRLDLFAGSPDEPESWLFIRSFNVGLGEGSGTPLGTFVIKKASKLVNPPWTNPRTGERFAADDPKNPIGEFWLGWQGLGDSAAYTGFGLHGTIDPASIGQSKSMGCVRMRAEDIALVYEMLVEQVSVVRVVP